MNHSPQTPQSPPRRQPYRRPMGSWWRRDPFFMVYMARELTSVAVWLQSLLLCLSLHHLASGPLAWRQWMQTLASPGMLALQGLILLCMLVHMKSWFDIMPKTMPMLHMGGQRLPAADITHVGHFAALVCNLGLLLLACLAGGRS